MSAPKYIRVQGQVYKLAEKRAAYDPIKQATDEITYQCRELGELADHIIVKYMDGKWVDPYRNVLVEHAKSILTDLADAVGRL